MKDQDDSNERPDGFCPSRPRIGDECFARPSWVGLFVRRVGSAAGDKVLLAEHTCRRGRDRRCTVVARRTYPLERFVEFLHPNLFQNPTSDISPAGLEQSTQYNSRIKRKKTMIYAQAEQLNLTRTHPYSLGSSNQPRNVEQNITSNPTRSNPVLVPTLPCQSTLRLRNPTRAKPDPTANLPEL
jgi:hypothetical protein